MFRTGGSLAGVDFQNVAHGEKFRLKLAGSEKRRNSSTSSSNSNNANNTTKSNRMNTHNNYNQTAFIQYMKPLSPVFPYFSLKIIDMSKFNV